MIEASEVFKVAAGLMTLAIVASYVWPRLVCGKPFTDYPPAARIVRCHLRPFHRGRCVRPWSSPEALGYLMAKPERCGSGHVHADLGDAIACSLGDPAAAQR